MSWNDGNDLTNVLIDGEIPPESTTKIKRSKASLQCVVCGDHAFGYNFDAISCESCKAFFRRNAFRPTRLRCRGNGHCEVNVDTRKRCKRCRIEKCFRMGMRKEWILTDEEKKRKKSKIEENRRNRRKKRHSLTSSTADSNTPKHTTTSSRTTTDDTFSHMTEVDWTRINLIQTAYSQSTVHNQVTGVPPYPAIQHIESPLELIQLPTYLSSIRLITYLKSTPEFELLNSDDRFTLVKHNLLAVVFVHIVLIYDPTSDTYHEKHTNDPVFQGRDWIHILGQPFYDQLTATIKSLINIIECNHVIAKFLLIIILYSKLFCAYDILHEQSLNNPMFVFNTQNLYLETLYKYCLHHYGYVRTIKLFAQLTSRLFSIQNLSIQFKDFVHEYIDASQLTPLMQAVLQIDDE